MKIKILLARFLALALVLASFTPMKVLALGETNRVLALGSSAASAVTTYAFSFKPGTSGNIGAIKFEMCDSPLEALSCVNTGDSSGVSFTSNSASVQSQGGISGFVAGTGSGGTPPAPTANTFWIDNSTPQNVNNTTTVTVTFQNVRNPSAANKEFYGRITTYSDTAGTGPNEVDFGAVAVATTNQIVVTGTMPESLVFCVGTSGTDCTNITGTSVALGTFSPTATNTGTSVMSASTNAGSGYVITVNGTTLTSGSNTITAMGTQSLNSAACSPSCSSTTGTSQFGTNVRDNTAPNVGTNVSGLGTATGFGGYNTVDSFRFFSGDTVASVGGVTKDNLFTNSYIVNVGGDQAAGLYTATLTYICTATF
jgi:hypothetical protein